VDKVCSFALKDSFDFYSKVQNLFIPDGYVLATIDVVNLYPSIRLPHLIELCEPLIKHYYAMHSPSKNISSFVVHLLRIVLQNQFVQHGDKYLHATCLATGLPPGVLLATLYLSSADNLVHNQFDHESMVFFYRFVDDGVFCGPANQLSAVLDTLNAWSYLRWEITYSGTQIVFLDRVLTIEQNFISTDMYIKPLNRRLFITPASAHPAQSFRSLVTGGSTRIFRACSHVSDVNRHVENFVQARVDRGHCAAKVSSEIRSTLCRLRLQHTRRLSKADQHYLVVTFSSSVNRRVLNHSLKRHAHMLTKPVGVSFKVQPSIFRLLHKSNWPNVGGD
jgi:hypothetical protein